MDKSNKERTPKLRPHNYSTSTAHKNKTERKINRTSLDFTNSVTMPSLRSLDISNIMDESQPSMTSVDDLQKQRSLAHDSIQNATSKLGLGVLPSLYFKRNFSVSEVSPRMQRSSDSTISESDLIHSVRNASTPRASIAELDASKGTPRKSMGDWSKMLSTDISLDHFMEDFIKQRDGVTQPLVEQDSVLFISGEEAAKQLQADEKSWRQRNEMPLVKDLSLTKQHLNEMPSTMSLGAYFGQKSDDLSSFGIHTSPPEKSRQPVALIDNSVVTSSFVDKEASVCADTSKNALPNGNSRTSQPNDMSLGMKTLSISTIEGIIKASADTPGKVADYLVDQARKINDAKKRHSSRPPDSQDFPAMLPKIKVERANSPNSTTSSGSLPVSRNISYTSNFSDNEAMKNIVENKENFNSLNISVDSTKSKNVRGRSPSPASIRQSKNSLNVRRTGTALSPDITPNCTTKIMNVLNVPSSTSRSASPASRSSSALSSLPDGKLPIDSTKNELVWTCVKVDKSTSHEFLVRNKSSKTFKIQCNVSGRDFKIRKDNRADSETLSACKLVFHANESRPMIVSFAPTKIGSAIDELTFSPLDSNLTQTKKQCVRLFGYGGHINIEYQGPMKDNTGKFWLSLGKLKSDKSALEHSFRVSNTGNLPAFVYMKFTPKRKPFFANLRVVPSFFVLSPNETETVNITYVLNSRDCKFLHKTLTDSIAANIGNLEVISDAEATRGRLRRLCRKCEEKKLDVDPLALALREKVRGEAIPADAMAFKESPAALSELLSALTYDEIALTIEQDPDQTLVPEFSDESVIFHTICVENTTISNETVVQPVSRESCKLVPPIVLLNPPAKTKDSLFLVSEMSTVQHFECDSVPAGLEISPAAGTLSPGETVILKVVCPRTLDHKTFKLVVYVDNDMFEADVKILVLSSSGKSQGSRPSSNFL